MSTPANSVPKLLTIKAALGLVPISRTSLYEAIKKGGLKSYLLMGRRLISEEDLLSWISASCVEA